MSFPNRALSSHIRHPSTSAGHVTAGHSSALLARINEKKIELENLKELRDLSAGLAAQMQTLEEKLATLSDGTEGLWLVQLLHRDLLLTRKAVATVLSNWHNVLRAINMASRESVVGWI